MGFFFFIIVFQDQGCKWCTPFPFTSCWLELNHMAPDGYKGDWEISHVLRKNKKWICNSYFLPLRTCMELVKVFIK